MTTPVHYFLLQGVAFGEPQVFLIATGSLFYVSLLLLFFWLCDVFQYLVVAEDGCN
jgi:hypothetical protein